MKLCPLKVAQFQAFDDLCRSVGFAKQIPRYDSIRTKATFDSDGAQENANGYELKFFQDANTAHVTDKQEEPAVNVNGVLTGNEVMALVQGIELEVQDLNGTTLTVTEVNELLQKLPDHLLEVKLGTDVVYKDRLKRCMASGPGWRASTDNAATPLVARTPFEVPEIPFLFDDPILLTPGTAISAKIIGNDTWTTTDDVILLLQFPGLIGLKGEPPKAGKGTIYTLSKAMRDLQSVRKQIELGA